VETVFGTWLPEEKGRGRQKTFKREKERKEFVPSKENRKKGKTKHGLQKHELSLPEDNERRQRAPKTARPNVIIATERAQG